MLTIEEIRSEVRAISVCARTIGSESAHVREDNLQMLFIEHVAAHGPPELSEMAKEIMKTYEIDFPRWFG